MNKGQLLQPLRALGLMHFMDKLKFNYQRIRNKKKNDLFRKEHPLVSLPPDYMLFEAFKLDYDKYYRDGFDSAQWLIDKLSPYVKWNGINILDWGCGPARIVRHLPVLLPDSNIYATDYNATTIEWCSKHIEGVEFSQNGLHPPTEYQEGLFTMIYGISIFTHLSEPNHSAWYLELIRILKPGGILLLTTHGKAFMEIMTENEKVRFEQGNLIVRDKAKEGHRVFTAFHPPAYMITLFSTNASIIKHTEGAKRDWGISQDVWILQKK